ncbi:phage tail protein [Solibacillus sp.]|uniref:phage tail protein n=1 Tax=Solibacillus sp. TaxID=1909654 RepID=UPI003314BCDE
MARIRITHAEQIEQLFDATPRQANIILWRALNRAATAAQTRASVTVRREYVIKAADVKKRIKIRKATAGNLSAQIRASGPVTPLMKFDVTPTFPDSTQVRARVKKGGRKPIQSGFVVRTGNSHVNVFTRSGRSRLPIKGRYGPSIAQMMGKDEIVEDIQTRAQDVLDKRLEHELDRLLRGEF